MSVKRYDYCKKCGHESGQHDMNKCVHHLGAYIDNILCDCDGWEYGNTHTVTL